MTLIEFLRARADALDAPRYGISPAFEPMLPTLSTSASDPELYDFSYMVGSTRRHHNGLDHGELVELGYLVEKAPRPEKAADARAIREIAEVLSYTEFGPDIDGYGVIARALARRWADHEDFRPEWHNS